MTQVVIGAISDRLGLAAGRDVYTRSKTHWACPANRFRQVQRADLVLEAGHFGGRLGAVVHLEHRADKLWAIGVLDAGFDLTRQPWQLSYDLVERGDGLFDLNAVAVVERSATCCMPEIEVRDGTLDHIARQVVYQDGLVGKLIKHASETVQTRRQLPADAPLLVRDEELEKRHEQSARHILAARQQASRPHGLYGQGRRVEHSKSYGAVLHVR